MIDVDLMVYAGTVALFVLAAVVIGIATVLVLSAVAVTASFRGRRKTQTRQSTREQRWFWRHDKQFARLDDRAGSNHPSGDYPPLTPDVDPHTRRRHDDAMRAPGGRHHARLRPSRVPLAPHHKTRKTKRSLRKREQPAS